MLFDVIRGNAGFEDFLLFAVSALIVIFVASPIHEMAHAFTAEKLGDHTAKYMGRLTINPFAHIDYIGALFIIIFGFGWAKPVPVNMRNFKKPKRDMAITALAGPVSNILVAFVSMILFYIFLLFFEDFKFGLILATIFYYVVEINVHLAVFNIIPIPPLDGSRILNAVLPDRIYYKIMQYERYFFIGFALLLYTGILTVPLSYISDLIVGGLSDLAYLPFKLFIG